MPRWLGGTERLNTAVTEFFTWLGTVCARHPTVTLALFSWIVAALMFGIQYMVIVTDPVELWAAPNSPSRMDKDHFDSRFGPFYRTNQIFIKPTNRSYVCLRTIEFSHNLFVAFFCCCLQITHETKAGTLTFGPAFNYEFLLEVFRLQQTIEQIGQMDGDGKGLEHICFAPVTYADEKPALDQCTVQSIFGYFGNSFDEFNRTSDDFQTGLVRNYLNRLDECMT